MPGNHNVYEDETLRIALRRNVMVAVWTASPTVAQVTAFQKAGERGVKAHPGGQVLINVVLRGVPSFSEDTRNALVKILKEGEMATLGTAHVLLLGGLAGSAVRAFLSTISLLARTKAPYQVFGETPGALSWAMEHLGRGPERWTREELRETVEEAIEGR